MIHLYFDAQKKNEFAVNLGEIICNIKLHNL